jgi:Zn-dependent protease
MKFYKQEIIDLIIASFTLALAFTIIIRESFGFNIGTFLFSSILIIPAFIIHELAHKFVAQHYGYVAAFIKFDIGLFIALLSSLFGFIFAAPGAVFISHVRSKDHILKISIAGPIINIIFAIMGLLIFIFSNNPLALIISFYVFHLNSVLAFFNLLPIPPLDGFKIFSINKLLWIITIIIAGALLAISFSYLGELKQ